MKINVMQIAIIIVAAVFLSSMLGKVDEPVTGTHIVPAKFVDTKFSGASGTELTAKVQLWNKGDAAGKTKLEVGLYAETALQTFNPSILQSAIAFKQIQSCKSSEEFVGTIELEEDLQPGDKKTVEVTLTIPGPSSKISSNVANWEGKDGEYLLVAGTFTECGTAHAGAITKEFKMK